MCHQYEQQPWVSLKQLPGIVGFRAKAPAEVWVLLPLPVTLHGAVKESLHRIKRVMDAEQAGVSVDFVTGCSITDAVQALMYDLDGLWGLENGRLSVCSKGISALQSLRSVELFQLPQQWHS